MRSMPAESDDRATIIAMAALACILQDLLHEFLGHGVTAWLSGAAKLTLSTVALSSDISTRWIDMNGTLVNLAAAAVLWIALRRTDHDRPGARYFLVLVLAGNLFTATGYFLFSGITDFGDWAEVIRGLPHRGLLRAALIAGGALAYFASMMAVGRELRPFGAGNADPRRLRQLCWTPYITEAALAAFGGLLNPAGLFYVIASALPSTLGANAGLLSLPSILRHQPRAAAQAGQVTRSRAWLVAGALASLWFVFVVGRGITWTR